MHTKKQRIISFTMAFLLIFTFAFVNPLTISKSQAALPVALAIPVQRIITSVVTSSGIITRLAQLGTNTAAIDTAIKNFVTMIFLTLTISERQELLNLEISEDNKVEVPTELYNSIKTSAEQLTLPETYSLTLAEQGITTKYSSIKSDSLDYSDLNFPVYEGTYEAGGYKYKKYDLTEAEPFFVYEGKLGATGLDKNNITKNIFNISNSTSDIPDYTSNTYTINCISEPLTMYNLPTYSTSGRPQQMYLTSRKSGTSYTLDLFMKSGSNTGNRFVYYSGSSAPYLLYENIFKVYFIKDSTQSNKIGIIYEILDLEGNTLYQRVNINNLNAAENNNSYGISTVILDNYSDTITTDLTFEQEANPTPVVSNTENTANVLTVPSELQGILESTSATINGGEVIDPDVPDNPTNTETLDNINTNVGELVTGGELGSEVNTNIEDVEGLHSEITDKVDFNSIFKTISQYISALDISSVTWFPAAVAGFIAPFLPLISLGLILFFIDRILNGGA